MFGWVIGKSSNKGKTPKFFAYLLEFFSNTQINVCLGEQLIIMMDVAVPRTKILTIALMCSLHAFYHKNITDSLNCYLAATVCLIVLKCTASLVFGFVCSLCKATSLYHHLKLLLTSSFVSWLALSLLRRMAVHGLHHKASVWYFRGRSAPWITSELLIGWRFEPELNPYLC